MYAGLDTSTGMPSSTEALYRAALGPSAAAAYLPFLARFEERGRSGPVWSLHAAAGNLLWLVYWRLWGAALVQAGLTVAAAGLVGWLVDGAETLPMGVRAGLVVSVCLLWFVLPAWWGVAWLHAGLRQRMTAAVEESGTFEEALGQLEHSARAWRIQGPVAAASVAVVVALLAGVLWQLSQKSAVSGRQDRMPPVQTQTQPPATAPDAAPDPVQANAPPAPVIPGTPIESPESRPAAPPVPSIPEVPGVRPRVRGFGVNVGMFAVEANAERVKLRLAGAGLPVLDDPVESARGPLTRVRVGPFERREQAEAAAQQVRALGLEARVYEP